MRLLDVSPRNTFPPTRGSMVRTSNLLRELAQSHEVRQLSLAVDGPPPRRARIEHDRPFDAYSELVYHHPLSWAGARVCARAWVRSNLLAGATQRLMRPAALTSLLHWAELVLVEFPWQFEAIRRIAPPGTPLVLAAHNVESDKFRSWAAAAGVSAVRCEPWIRLIEHAERAAVASADLVIAVSERDRQTFLDRFGADPARVVTAPNGTDTERIRPTLSTARPAARRALGLPERPTVLFQAADMPANVAGLDWVRRLARADRSRTYLVVGSVAEPGRDERLIATGAVPEMAPYLAAADAALCPIAHGGGTKIKLLESMAAGLPVVAFAEALSGTEALAGEHVLVAERSERSLLRCLDELQSDEGARGAELATNARRLVEERYDWARIARALEPTLVGLVGDRRKAPRPAVELVR